MIEAYINKLEAFCRQRKLDKFEIRYRQEENTTLQVYEQKVSEAKDNFSESISLTVLHNGKKGHFETADFDEKKIPLVVDEALANAEAIDTEENFFLHDGSGNYESVKPYQPLPQLAKTDKIRYLKDLEALAYEADNRVNKVIKTCFVENRTALVIRNSLGLKLSKNKNGAYAYIYLSASNGKTVKTDSEAVFFNRPEDFVPQTVVNVVVPRLVSRLNAADVKSGKYSVVFDKDVAGDLLEAIQPIFSSYSLDTGATKLKDRIGEQVASSLVTVTDNPWLDGGLATTAFDGDGVPTRPKDLVKNGILQGFVYGLALADKHKTRTTGNGGGGLRPMFFNLYIQNGETGRDEMFRQLENGIYIDKLNGLSAGLSIASGDFSVGAEGFLIENGKPVKALNQFTVSGNIYRLLQDIKAVGCDLDLTRSSVGAPSLLAENLTIGGC